MLGKQDGISINDDISHKTGKFDGDPTIGSKVTTGEIILNRLGRVLIKKKPSFGNQLSPNWMKFVYCCELLLPKLTQNIFWVYGSVLM